MSEFRKVQVFIDNRGNRVDAAGSAVKPDDTLNFAYNETFILCIQALDCNVIDALNVVAPLPLFEHNRFSAFAATADEPENLLFCSEETIHSSGNVNAAGDYTDNSTANPAEGQLSFKISTNTSQIRTLLNNNTEIEAQIVISSIPPGENSSSVIAMLDCRIVNRPGAVPQNQPTAAMEYYTANQVNALLASGMEVEFSATGVNSSENSPLRRPADHFFRLRNTAIPNAEWSGWIELFDGKSAYKVWLEAGNSGSEEEFFLSLKPIISPVPVEVKINTASIQNNCFTATLLELNLSAEMAVQLYNPAGNAVNPESIPINWSNGRLTVDFSQSQEPGGIWTLRFAAGADRKTFLESVTAAPLYFNSECGYYYLMDAETPLTLLTSNEKLVGIVLTVRTQNYSTGNAVFSIQVNGEQHRMFVAEVSPTNSLCEIKANFPISGQISIAIESTDSRHSISEPLIVSRILTESLI